MADTPDVSMGIAGMPSICMGGAEMPPDYNRVAGTQLFVQKKQNVLTTTSVIYTLEVVGSIVVIPFYTTSERDTPDIIG